MSVIENPSRCPHCQQMMPGTAGIPIAEAVERYAAHWGHKPETRWISAAAKRLGLYYRAGKRAYIVARHWDRFIEEAGKWGSVSASESIARRTAQKRSTRASAPRLGKRMEKSDGNPVKEALALAKS
jgi:hypothetical protein